MPEIKPEDSFAWKPSSTSTTEKVPTHAFIYQPLKDSGGSTEATAPEATPAANKVNPVPAIETTMTITPKALAATSPAKELSPPPVGLAATIINRSEHMLSQLPQTQSPDVILLQKRRGKFLTFPRFFYWLKNLLVYYWLKNHISSEY